MKAHMLEQGQCFLVCVKGGDECQADIRAGNSDYNIGVRQVPALFTFGDSIVDPGNNNFIPTLVKANFPPHGRDFIDQEPTGRFCNGKLSTDFIAAGLGLKDRLPPFLDPLLDLQDLLTGVSFASAGTGYDNLTAEAISVIPLWKQMEYFKEYKSTLTEMVGEVNSSFLIGEAIFLISAGTNDFLGNYNQFPLRRQQFNIEEYEDFLVEICSNFIEKLYKAGGRKFGVYGIPPPGCLPLSKTLYGQPNAEGCIQELNKHAVSYNTKLKSMVRGLKLSLPQIKVTYIDIYNSFHDIVQNPVKYGFEISSRGCCGTGLTEVGPTCNSKNTNTCLIASKYVFWDAVHSTEKTYEITAKMVLEAYISKLL
ncbi:hypothetical protein SUGI_0171290 [Cryptomeria japonica]|nr:hypothetical protein SUGI_0171290 [Cryptomeria japonica]